MRFSAGFIRYFFVLRLRKISILYISIKLEKYKQKFDYLLTIWGKLVKNVRFFSKSLIFRFVSQDSRKYLTKNRISNDKKIRNFFVIVYSQNRSK